MRELFRATIITTLVTTSAMATMAGYDLVLAQIDSLFMTTYSPENFSDVDSASVSLKETLAEIQASKHSLDATNDSTDIDRP